MSFQGRSVFILICMSMVISSVITLLATGGPDGTNEAAVPDDSQAVEESPDGGNENGNIDTGSGTDHDEADLSKVHEAYNMILSNYVLDVDEEELLEGAIEGMLQSLDDPYSVYMDAEEAQQFQENFQSSFEGIGAEVMMQDGRVTIVSPIRGSPAEEAGLRPNDQILSVDGEPLEDMDINQAVMLIRGPQGSEAELEISRAGQSSTMTVTVVRDEIPLETVYTDIIYEDGKTLGKIELTSFAQETASRFEDELTYLEQEGIDGLIIDVRGNPGGYLDAVREIGQLIVPEEGVITEIRNRDEEKMVYRSTLEEAKPYPITILIDEGSASASEILAAALQEAGGYTVVGEPSFGKGSVQSSLNMTDESEIKLTMAKWLTPDGNWIDGEGVQPDEQVSQPDYFRATRIPADTELELDMHNDHVQNMQLILDGLGYDPGRTDGFFDEDTQTAVRHFQRDYELDTTGVVDEQTARQMEEILMEMIADEENDHQLHRAVEVLLDQI